MKISPDTICAPATSVGTGAVTVIRVSGPEALAVADRLISFRKGSAASSEGYTLKFGEIPGVDEVIAGIYRAPHSYTGEDAVEISCHASRYIAEKILSLLCEAGARPAEPGEFTRRAFLNGKMDLAQAEAVADLIAADTQAAHRVAVNQLKGGYSKELRELRDALVEIASLMELELDFSEEDVEFADRAKLRMLLEKASAHISALADSFRAGNAIKNGVPVAIVGPVNAGKSTLLNALLGEERAIVSDIPGTTRDTVEETLTLGGILFRFIDTAGLRDTSDTIEIKGIERSYASLEKAEVVIGVLDAMAPQEESLKACEAIKAALSPAQSLILVRNKVDALASVSPVDGLLDISAKTGDGLDALRARLLDSRRPLVSDNNATLVTNLRHYEALRSAGESISRVQNGLDAGLSQDLLAEDLRSAIYSLNSIFGEVTSSEILETIFSRFCIGK